MNQGIIVIKIGSNVIFGNSARVDLTVLENIATEISALRAAGYGVVLVSSGAVAAGREQVGWGKDYSSAFLAAIGQARLTRCYQEIFKKHDIMMAQILLSGRDFYRARRLATRQTLLELLRQGIVPVINENDVVTARGGGFGNNDWLAALAAVNLKARAVVFMTNVDGVYSHDPAALGARLLAEIDSQSPTGDFNCLGKISSLGKGGMASKVQAAASAVRAGSSAYIINGLVRGNLLSLFTKGRAVGTRVL